ncbi:MAG: DUF4349 domain-containing protein [Kofleriaceae bacterium]
MKLLSMVLMGSLAVTGCAEHKKGASADHAALEAAPTAMGSAAANDKQERAGTTLTKTHVDTRKVIRTGRIDVVVDSVDLSRTALDTLVQGAGGYIDSTQVEQRGTSKTATFVVRIPADAFGTILPALQQLGTITAESTNANDITDQFVDTEAQLASAQQLEKRLLELATAKNGTLDQVLTVERELARVRGEIEGFQGHLKQWNDQVSLSTLSISMTQKSAPVAIVVPPAKTLGSETSQSFHSSIDTMKDLGSWLVVSGVALLPWLLVFAPIGLFVRRIARRYRRIPVAIATNVPS